MNRQPVLEGERLRLRQLEVDDWQALFGVASDPMIWEVHPAHNRWQEPIFRTFFEDALEQGGTMTGSSRYQFHDPANGGVVEIGWTFLARSCWGGSYNREMKRLMLAHAFKYVGRVAFIVGEGNLRSRRAMEKIGGSLTDYREERIMANGTTHHVFYEITREDFAMGPLMRQ